jgi:hypothetical protein
MSLVFCKVVYRAALLHHPLDVGNLGFVVLIKLGYGDVERKVIRASG